MSLNDGVAGVQENPPFLLLLLTHIKRRGGKVGILSLDFHFSTAVAVGAVGMWESRLLRFPRAVGNDGKPAFRFSSFSIVRHFHSPPRFSLHALRLRFRRVNNARFAFCIRRAADVSLIRAASAFSPSTVNPAFRCRAKSGN